jgi:hypothetical protein
VIVARRTIKQEPLLMLANQPTKLTLKWARLLT